MESTETDHMLDKPMPLGHHLAELRKAILYPLILWTVVTVLGLVFQQHVVRAFLWPIKKGITQAVSRNPELLKNNPTGPGISSPRSLWVLGDNSVIVLRSHKVQQVLPDQKSGWSCDLPGTPIAADLSPDGSLLAVALLNGQVILVRMADGRQVSVARGVNARELRFVSDQKIALDTFSGGLVFMGRDGELIGAARGIVPASPPSVGNPLNIAPLAVFIFIMKAAAIFGLIPGLPFLALSLWRFIKPGLFPKEQRIVKPILFAVSVLFYIGAAFAYFLVIPLIAGFLYQFNARYTIVVWDVAKYLELTFGFVLAFGIVFQLPLVIILVTRMGLISIATLSAQRKIVWLLATLLAAFLTPPDPVSQLMMALPTILLFEIGLLVARILPGEGAQVENQEPTPS